MRRAYLTKSLSLDTEIVISQAVSICRDYAAQGYDLTLRQLYYRFIALDLFDESRRWYRTANNKWVKDPTPYDPVGTKNADPNYKWLGGIITDARLTGLLDWSFIVDRTRETRIPAAWNSPAEIMEQAILQYQIDLWEGQDYRVEVWVEKDALGAVVERACQEYRLPWLSCRGYLALSTAWEAAQRFRGYIDDGQIPVILHLADHDPSGIDMTRDLESRLQMFMVGDWRTDQWGDQEVDEEDVLTHMGEWVERQREVPFNQSFDWADLPLVVDRVALNMTQIRLLGAPPSPAKVSDSRGKRYVEIYGRDSWELDALEPQDIVRIVETATQEYLDADKFRERQTLEQEQISQMRQAQRKFE